MSDEPFYAPGRTIPPRTGVPGEVVWTLVKGMHIATAELRPPHAGGVELQIVVDAEMRRAQLYADRADAIAEAMRRREEMTQRGWTPPL